MFHSSGITQSKTLVPVGTSVNLRGITSCKISKDFLRPFPVMLLHNGHNLQEVILNHFQVQACKPYFILSFIFNDIEDLI